MLLDVEPFVLLTRSKNGAPDALSSFVQFLEKKFGVVVAYDRRTIPFGRSDLRDQFILAQKLIKAGIIKTFYPAEQFPDEPPIKLWTALSPDDAQLQTGGGSWQSDRDALTAALAEALERYIWKQCDDYFARSIFTSTKEMRSLKRYFIPPERFASFSPQQRTANNNLSFTDSTSFLWIQGTSLITGKKTFVPAQTVTGLHRHEPMKEPLIRNRDTNGLATWPTQAGAQLAGAMELIERDAYMIMWWNQLTLPRLDLQDVANKSPELAAIIEKCDRYRLRPHFIPLITDAPAHAVCTLLEDVRGNTPRFGIGLKAHRSLIQAIEKSTLEALRGRRHGRRALSKGTPMPVKASDIGHYDRVPYWAQKEKSDKLAFIVAGDMKQAELRPWDTDTEGAHLARVVSWCRESGYEFVSVPLTRSRKNPTKLHVEMVTIPELQPIHLSEKNIALGGSRWNTIPQKYGFEPRKEMYTEEPHPFA